MNRTVQLPDDAIPPQPHVKGVVMDAPKFGGGVWQRHAGAIHPDRWYPCAAASDPQPLRWAALVATRGPLLVLDEGPLPTSTAEG